MPARLLFAVPIVLALASTAVAVDWDAATLLDQELASSFQVSPDGGRAVFVKRFLDDERKAFRWQLFLAELTGDALPAEPRQLTRHEAGAHSPRWSPDGLAIAFLTARGEAEGEEESPRQIWRLDLRGGEPEAITEHDGGVADFRWLPDGRLLYLAGEGKTRWEKGLAEEEDGSIVVGDEEHRPTARLFRLDPERGEAERVTANHLPIIDFEPSPDGRRVVGRLSASLHDEYDQRSPPRVFLWDLDTGEPREILPPGLRASGFVWDRKGEGFWFRRPVASDPSELFVSLDLLGRFDVERGEWYPVDIGWERGLDWSGDHATEKGLFTSLADGARNRLLHLEGKGAEPKLRLFEAGERGLVSPIAVGPDGKTVLFARGNASSPDRFLVAELRKDDFKNEREFMRLNAFLDELPLPRTETIRWAGARGDTVEGMLHYPLDWKEGEPRPLVVMVHGGPAGTDRDTFVENWGGSPGLMCSRGAFVLRPNYHGSAGYGLEWLESIKGRYYELEVPDILAGVERLIELGLADASRLGIQGWSNGAILAIAVCLETEARFRVLDAGAGDVNWSSDWGNCSFGAAFDRTYLGGHPWEIPQVYVDKSPIFRIDELQVPTIIFFGTEDTNVPTEQGWQLYRGLQQSGDTPVRFLLFPGEGHTVMNPVHRRRQMAEEMAWFDRHLFGTHTEVNAAFAEDSPLGRALALADAASAGAHYGEDLEGLLVPELVEVDGLLVGRFEVTRAQWVAHAGDAEADLAGAREGNLPVTGISLDEAKAYCEWLAGVTGFACRLPTVEEWEKLAALAGEHANTLAWWAGYGPNLDDGARLESMFELLEANRSLLEPVGSFAPEGAAGLYDIGGNAAEWVLGEEGAGEARGPSARTLADPFADHVAPPAAYVGFRVVATPVNDE